MAEPLLGDFLVVQVLDQVLLDIVAEAVAVLDQKVLLQHLLPVVKAAQAEPAT
jgi:hypothetical protein